MHQKKISFTIKFNLCAWILSSANSIQLCVLFYIEGSSFRRALDRSFHSMPRHLHLRHEKGHHAYQVSISSALYVLYYNIQGVLGLRRFDTSRFSFTLLGISDQSSIYVVLKLRLSLFLVKILDISHFLTEADICHGFDIRRGFNIRHFDLRNMSQLQYWPLWLSIYVAASICVSLTLIYVIF